MTRLEASIAAPRPRPVVRIVSWWLHELAGIAAAAKLAGRRRRIILFFSEAGLEVHIQSAGGTKLLAPVKPGEGDSWRQSLHRQLQSQGAAGAPVVLRLAKDQVLEKTIFIPAAAEDVLAPVLRNQMQRYAPWPLEQTKYGYEIIGRDAARGLLETRIVATSREQIDKALAEAAKTGLTPHVIEQGATARIKAGIMLVDLKAPERDKHAQRLGRWIGGLMALSLAAGLFGTAQLLKQRGALAVIESETATVRLVLKARGRRHAERAALARQNARLVARKRQRLSAAGVLETLSRALPDDAWLTEFELKGRVVRLQGKSKNAADLIKVIESAPHYAAARFSAPTTRNDDSDLEAFAITAEIVPGVRLKE